MNVRQALARARNFLASGGTEDVDLESAILLRCVLKLNRVNLLLSLDKELTRVEEDSYRKLIDRRLTGEPTAYITNNREFFGLDFYVDQRVLIPRPETELLVTKALELAKNNPAKTISDIGTGCGNITISLAVNLPGTRFYATDISADALEVAQINAKRHGVNHITFLQGSLLEPLPGPVDIIVSNLPYVRQSELKLVNTAGFEPVLALDGGEQGLDMISQLCHQAMNKLNSGGCLLLEIGVGQREVVVKQLKSLFPRALIEVFRDPGGVDRVVRMRN